MRKLTDQEVVEFKQTTICHICEKNLGNDQPIVMDHDHFTSEPRGFCHQNCNLNYKTSFVIPVIFHNLSGYDAHFIIMKIATAVKGALTLLAINDEKYISFTKSVGHNNIKFKFIDSYRFMSASLDELVSNLSEYKILYKNCFDGDSEKFKLLTRKGVSPYDYINCIEKLNETSLPPIEAFYNKLNGTNISQADYQHAEKIWQSFNIKSLKEYNMLYMRTDILLLADVFEAFRKNCMKHYKLDLCHSYTLPGYAWKVMLKITGVTLELLTDPDMLLMFEKGIRGGISQCCHRYEKANNKYMPNYNPNEETKFITYFDVNNLYGWAMTAYLPYGGFKWVTKEKDEIMQVPDDSPKGYVLEVDLDYPNTLHDEHNDLPFCPTHEIPPGSKQRKLLTTLHSKKKNVIHYRNLKQCIENGLILNKIHRIIEFDQSPWLKPYIDLNTQLRANATNKFDQNCFKLMNNAVFGKSMENVRKHVDIKLVSKWNGQWGARCLISKPNFHKCKIFTKNLVAIELTKTEIKMNKPIYLGMCILEISKILIYLFHYSFMCIVYGNRCYIVYMDTDSLVYVTKGDLDIYKLMADNIDKFDTSNYAENNAYNLPLVNKRQLGLMKDELGGQIITEFVGLRSKMYAMRVNDEDKIKKIKGIKSNIVKTTITFNDFLNCLNSNQTIYRSQNTLRSKKHVMYSIKQSKVALSANDDKRVLIGNHHTLAHGHFKLNEISVN